MITSLLQIICSMVESTAVSSPTDGMTMISAVTRCQSTPLGSRQSLRYVAIRGSVHDLNCRPLRTVANQPYFHFAPSLSELDRDADQMALPLTPLEIG